MLYNGIELPHPWPPRRETLTTAPLPLPPYLVSPPAVIPIDVGRQLFVDDFLVAESTLKRTYHAARYHPASPVLVPDRPWEMERGPTAMPFSDGAWYDREEGLFKLWYMGGYTRYTCYATSRDGLHWEKPALDVVPGTNIVDEHQRDSNTVWPDPQGDPTHRYRMVLYGLDHRLWITHSPDGIHWAELTPAGPAGDRTTLFYNPFRRVWVYSLREYLRGGAGRVRRYWEHPDPLAGAKWREGEPTLWVGADDLDPRRPELDTQPELYNLDCAAYESLVIGLFDVWRGQPSDRPKPNELCLGFSRDGFHWHRPDRRPFLPVSERYGDWNWGNVQSAGGCCLVVGDELRFYVSGRAGVPGTSDSGVCTTGLAVLRRDGFASLDAAEAGGQVLTRPVRFAGRHLFVNAAVAGGELRAEVVDERGQAIPPFTAANCLPVTRDGTRQPVRWQGAADLEAVAGREVRFRFTLRGGSLYAFWVSAHASGESGGYVGVERV